MVFPRPLLVRSHEQEVIVVCEDVVFAVSRSLPDIVLNYLYYHKPELFKKALTRGIKALLRCLTRGPFLIYILRECKQIYRAALPLTKLFRNSGEKNNVFIPCIRTGSLLVYATSGQLHPDHCG
jgi:hypothetical protein